MLQVAFSYFSFWFISYYLRFYYLYSVYFMLLSNINESLLFREYGGSLRSVGKKTFIDYVFNGKDYFCRLLLDRYDRVQLICTYDFADSIFVRSSDCDSVDGVDSDFVSESAKELWKEFLYPASATDLRRLSDATLTDRICESGGMIISYLFRCVND